MGKEKKRKEDGDKKELTFYYEIVGIITILISIITLARLGNSGKWLMIFFKLLFGDWYFVTLFLLLVYGFRSLLFHQPMEVKTMRFMGIVIFRRAVLDACTRTRIRPGYPGSIREVFIRKGK